MDYIFEKNFIAENVCKAFEKYGKSGNFVKTQKSRFDLVTDVDKNIENYLKEAIYAAFPNDRIISEETLSLEKIAGRTWIIDPIDGTCNMAHGLKLYGVQCALVDNGEIVMSYIYLPWLNEEYYALAGCGAYLNGNRISVSAETELENSIVSFGDYSHKADEYAVRQHRAIGVLYPVIAKIRMFGAACHDFTFMAGGKIDATVVLTNNLWDICAGVLLCREAGAILTNLEGEPYSFGDFGVVASSNAALHKGIIEAFK